ncbi:PIG-X [Mycena crocata]|nr:PIG-X [Mycena crocata]
MQSSFLDGHQSFHPIFKTSISAPGFANCSLHLHYHFPVLVFVDPYELSNRANEYSFKHVGKGNLELPVAALGPTDVSDLLLSIPRSTSDRPLSVEVPLHVRYAATAAAPFHRTELSWPNAFFACRASSQFGDVPSADGLPTMPLNFAAPFAGLSIFRLATPEGSVPIEVIRTPVGDFADGASVELGTFVVVLGSLFYVVRAARRAVARMNPGIGLSSDEY